ncbi:hypothetical protein AB0J20_03985 [Micromonospora costi]|uniref:hypothetical protein n=1 Tax=Micromonospora costi TaxID=1530042 RepID=UPI0034045E5F
MLVVVVLLVVLVVLLVAVPAVVPVAVPIAVPVVVLVRRADRTPPAVAVVVTSFAFTPRRCRPKLVATMGSGAEPGCT